MNARDIMTKDIITIQPDTTIGEAITQLVDHQISGVPVLDNNKELVGVVTEKDLLVAFDFLRKTEEPVQAFMSKGVIGVNPDTSVDEISRLLVQRNIKRVPVVDNNKLIGIVSRRDVLKHIIGKI
jgi:tRNA nucleotidyltransferase (CCA-adding enzyme)